jgi:ketosteroid isomerase-like protein
MNTGRTICGAILLATAFFSNAQTQLTMKKQDFTPDQQAVMNAILEMTSAFHKKDIDGVMASYEPNPVIVFEPEKPVSDPAAIRDGFFGFFAVNPTFEYSGHEVFINGNLAMHFAPWTMTGTAPDGTPIRQSGLSVAVLRKQADGKWLMVFDNPFGQHLLDKR